ncbi:MAG: hypothetical protein Q7U52_00005 [Hydrogenophaga sp.]|uniref:hypothetical protein n=1 Tax=Hydrogenophaga sp. TaxID=1904254 RepID=UPI00271C7A42|nr:hypothetical protein [Hydrogenophaga sp.]MDO9146065.1 hypothetical protein [Hydrogenophaga sp.]MDO9604402.1 hypothetical protein [Hydrogenophaga sp.]
MKILTLRKYVVLGTLAAVLGGIHVASASDVESTARVASHKFQSAGSTRIPVGSSTILFPAPAGYTDAAKDLPEVWRSLVSQPSPQVTGAYFLNLGTDTASELASRAFRAPYVIARFDKTMRTTTVTQRDFDQARLEFASTVHKLPTMMSSPQYKATLDRIVRGLGYDAGILSTPVSLGVDANQSDRFLFSQIATITMREGQDMSQRTMVRSFGAVYVRSKILYVHVFRDYTGEESVLANKMFMLGLVDELILLNR